MTALGALNLVTSVLRDDIDVGAVILIAAFFVLTESAR